MTATTDPNDGPESNDGPDPYVAVIFSSTRRTGRLAEPGRPGDDSGDGYDEMAERMDELARRQPGFLGIESARGADGFGITVSTWATDADARAWKQVAEHLGAQRLGRERWYASYRTRVATVTREYAWSRDD